MMHILCQVVIAQWLEPLSVKFKLHVQLPHSRKEVYFLEVQFLSKFILLEVSGKILLSGTVC